MKLFLTTAFLLSFSFAFGQQEFSLFTQSHLPQAAINANPGNFTDHKWNVILPGAYGGFLNSSFQMSDIMDRTANGYKINLEPAIRKMENQGNALRTSLSAHVVGLTFRTKKDLQFTFFHNTHFDMQLTYPKSLPALLWRGNGAFLGERVEVAPNLNLLGYNEYGMGFATRANKKMIFGINLKLVNGFVGVRTEKANTFLTTDEEYYQLTFENDVEIQTAGFANVLDENEEDVLAEMSPEYLIILGNQGFSVDLGMTYEVTKRFQLQVAVQDFGYISWENQVFEHSSQGTYTYDGQIVRPFSDDNDEFDFEQVRDTITDIFEFNSSEKPFLSNFPIKGFVSGQYKMDPSFNLGASLHFEQFADAGVTNVALALHAQKRFGRNFYLGGVAGFHNDKFAFLGANSTLQLGPVQFYIMTDNLITILDPTFGQFTNVRTGLNLSFGRNTKKEKGEKKERNVSIKYF